MAGVIAGRKKAASAAVVVAEAGERGDGRDARRGEISLAGHRSPCKRVLLGLG